MLFIDSDTIGNAAPIKDWIGAMELAFRDTAEGKVDVPLRSHIDRGENTHLVMPCFGEKYFSTKLVSVYPGNIKRREPVIYGAVVLNDGKSGKPLAVLDGSKLTAMRTAAVGSVGIDYLSDAKSDSLGLIGLGIQGFHQALFACQIRPISKIRILDRTLLSMKRFQERFKAYYKEIEVIPSKSTAELCNHSDIIITATSSLHPVVPKEGNWWRGKTLIGIGSYKPEMREFPDEIFRDVHHLYVDTLHGLSEAGDLIEPVKNGILKQDQIIPISDLIMNKSGLKGDTQFFKSVGMAAFDLYGARLVYESLA